MDYSKMSESMLLRTIVEEELSSYEARFGKAVCPAAKTAYIKKIISLFIIGILIMVSLKVFGITIGLTCLFILLFVKRESIRDIFQFSGNPIVPYVSELAKKNPDTKMKDIIFAVCENTSYGSSNYYMGNDDYSQYAYGTKTVLMGIETPEQKRRGKVISIVSVAILIAGLLGIAGFYMIPRVSYVDVDGGYMVQSFKLGFSLDGKAVIPDNYNGKPVVAVNNGAFKGDPFMKTIELPDTIETIGGEAFMNCRRLEWVHIPEKVTQLRGNTFEGCTSLRYVELPEGIQEIHGECFVNCKKLQKINLPPHITEIKGNTFEGCSSLRSIVIPEGVTRIGGHAFYGCSSLSEVKVPSTVESIGSSAFRKCDSLRNIELPEGVLVNERAFKESPTSIAYYKH